MKKTILPVLILFLTLSCGSNADVKPDIDKILSDPKLVVEELFRAANTDDYSLMSQLCDPNGEGDGDTKSLCEMAEGSAEHKAEYVGYFKMGKVTGDTEYSESADGTKRAAVPFWFNHPGGESRSNETMNLLQRDGKWYLYSF